MPKKKPIQTAVRHEPTRVASPTVPGAVEHVMRSVDTLSAMGKRRQLTEREVQAGLRYRTAHDAIHSQLGGSMDFERTRGSAVPGQPFGSFFLEASELINSCRKILYPRDYAVVHRVCAEGQSLEECAKLFGEGRPASEEAGRRLRAGLSELADAWYPEPSNRGRIRSLRLAEADVTDVDAVDRHRSYVHA